MQPRNSYDNNSYSAAPPAASNDNNTASDQPQPAVADDSSGSQAAAEPTDTETRIDHDDHQAEETAPEEPAEEVNHEDVVSKPAENLKI